MSGRNIYLLHFNGRHDNLGDQFIFRALVNALADHGTVYLRNGRLGFVADARPVGNGLALSWRSGLTKLRGGAVYTFLSPGGRTSVEGGSVGEPSPKVRRPFSLARKALVRLMQVGFAAVSGRRVAIGTSVVPWGNHAWCQGCDWVGVRDNESLASLREARVPRVEYFPDLAFLPAPPQIDSAQRSGICASFRRSIPEARDAEIYESRLSGALGALIATLNNDARGSLQMFHQVEEDESFVQRLAVAHGVAFHAPLVSLESFESFYGSAEIVVSNRLHCLLMGAYCGAVPVALTSREHVKVNALFTTVGWESLILPIEEIEELPRRLARIQDELPTFQHLIARSFAEQRRVGLSMLDQRFGGKPQGVH